jgi:hypothetical protein
MTATAASTRTVTNPILTRPLPVNSILVRLPPLPPHCTGQPASLAACFPFQPTGEPPTTPSSPSARAPSRHTQHPAPTSPIECYVESRVNRRCRPRTRASVRRQGRAQGRRLRIDPRLKAPKCLDALALRRFPASTLRHFSVLAFRGLDVTVL